ncbi:MAG: malto-oligosyltrehalose synthase [Kastovskya adunca ATA6-11-RM4]|jgi:(1->4)-alpha-D-glucan 1-alpha-D-glucosylmutase|nr:malto-oligosyltrehalose synthase [Kastovskya adunca ATA6-11-RM4]
MRIPAATYRIQFHVGFNFEAAKKIVPYLSELGISDLYASPIFKATEGSTHGYDVVDPTVLNPELGTPEDFKVLVQELQQRQMGWLQDIVPNHMAYAGQNQMLMDVLENGPDSEFFDYFDIAWDQSYEDRRGRVLAPLLGNFYGDSLENGEIQLQYDQTGLSVNYYNLRLPIRIESYVQFLTHELGKLARTLGRQHPDFVKLLGILYLLKNLPSETKGRERYDHIAFVKGLLWELYTQNPAVEEFIQHNIETFNGESGNSKSFDLLDSLLSDQFYRLAFWKVGAEEINYRRFFTVNELISVKVEELKVFNKTHSLISQLVEEGAITGLRIDHIDGLYDPTQYLERLREKMGDVYITVEKILELDEQLPNFWPIQGTSGYNFLNYVNGIFCKSVNEERMRSIYAQFTNLDAPYEELVKQKKALIVEKNLAGDADNLAQLLKRISGQTRGGSDFTQYGLKRALVEILTLFPVYRTYVNEDGLDESDRQYVQAVIAKAREDLPLLSKELDYIEEILLQKNGEPLTSEQKAERLHFVMRMQQLTGPLMAKGVEDTLLYVYNLLLSLNEVGGNPGHFGLQPADFHAFNQTRKTHWSQAMSATSTHDTKRGEDARARINILSEIPDEWETQVRTWSELNRQFKKLTKNRAIPSSNDEYFLYQTLIGAFPFDEREYPEFITRVKDYMIKAVREAKVYTAWLRPDNEYEEGFISFVESILQPSEQNQFLEKFRPFQKVVADYGIYNSLSQILLKNMAVGVPDLYQGTELWDLSMVDPDNRRPVDYEQRVAFLQDIKEKAQQDILKLVNELLSTKEDGKIKLFLTYKVLQARNENMELFLKGDYLPLKVVGKFQDCIVAFARQVGDKVAITVAPRLLTSLVNPGERPLGDVWEDTAIQLPAGMPSVWKDAIAAQTLQGNEAIPVSEVLKNFPVALLFGQSN